MSDDKRAMWARNREFLGFCSCTDCWTGTKVYDTDKGHHVSVASVPQVKITVYGHSCVECNEFNEYAESNRPEGGYLCYKCRR